MKYFQQKKLFASAVGIVDLENDSSKVADLPSNFTKQRRGFCSFLTTPLRLLVLQEISSSIYAYLREINCFGIQFKIIFWNKAFSFFPHLNQVNIFSMMDGKNLL